MIIHSEQQHNRKTACADLSAKGRISIVILGGTPTARKCKAFSGLLLEAGGSRCLKQGIQNKIRTGVAQYEYDSGSR